MLNMFSRGGAKSTTSYLNMLAEMYRNNEISKKEYIVNICLVARYSCGISEEDVLRWVETESDKYCKKIKQKNKKKLSQL